MIYAKLVDSQLIPLRQPLSIAGRDTYTNDEAILRAQGWKPILLTDPPEQEGHYATSEWAETADAITHVWTLHEAEVPAPTPHEIIDILTGEVD